MKEEMRGRVGGKERTVEERDGGERRSEYGECGGDAWARGGRPERGGLWSERGSSGEEGNMAQEEERKGSEVSFLHPFLVIQRPSKWERSPASGVPSSPARPLC